MVRFWTPRGCTISLGVLTGRFDPDAVISELLRADAEGDQRPGQDRLTVLAPDVDPDDMTLEGFMRIYQVSVQLDALAQDNPGRSVFVTQAGRRSRGALVYFELRRKLPGAVPDYALFHDVASASAALGVPDLSPHFRPWPALAEFLTQ